MRVPCGEFIPAGQYVFSRPIYHEQLLVYIACSFRASTYYETTHQRLRLGRFALLACVFFLVYLPPTRSGSMMAYLCGPELC